MGELNLQFIGTGNAFAPNGLCWNGFVVNGRYLFEAPPQALQSLNHVGINANDLDAVILSHHHGDHFLGLPFLLLHWRYQGRTRPARIIGPPGTRGLTMEIAEKVYPGVFDIKYELQWEELRPGEGSRLNGLAVEAVAVKHDDRLSSPLGYEATASGRRFAYTGDSAMCDAVLDMARNSEVLVSECASRNDTIDIHMNLRDDIPRVRAAMKPESSLLLTHLGPGVDASGLAHTLAAEDYKTYRL